MPDTNKIPTWDETQETPKDVIPKWEETTSELKKKEISGQDSVPGLQIPEEVSKLYLGGVPKSPFEKQALGQPPIDEAIVPQVPKPKITAKKINPDYADQGIGEENWKALKSASLRTAGAVVGIPNLLKSTVFEYIQKPILKATGITDEEINVTRQAMAGALPQLSQIGQQKFNEAATGIENTMKQYEYGISESLDKGNFRDAGRQLIKGVTQSLPYLAMVAGTSGGGTPAVLTSIGVSAASQRKGELEQTGQFGDKKGMENLNAWLYGGFEAGSEIFTMGIFNNMKRALRGASEDVVKKTASELSSDFMKEFFGEAGTEGTTELGQQLTDYFMDQRDDVDLKQVLDAAIVGGFAVAPVSGVTTFTDYVKGSRIAPKEDIRKVQDNQEKIVDLKDKLEETENPVIKETIQQEISQTEKENSDIAEKNAVEAKKLTQDEYKEVSDIVSAIYENDAALSLKKENKEDVSIEEDVKAKLEEKRKEILDKKPVEKPIQEGIAIGEKVEATPSMKRILSTGEENVFTRPIQKDGVEFGEITIEEKPEGWQVKRVDVNEEKKGYGKQVYRTLNAEAQKEGKVIISDRPDKISNKAQAMWNSLVKSNEAIKNEDGSYQMLPKIEEQIVEPKITEEPTNAEGIYENAGQVQERGNVGPESEGNGGPNLEQQKQEQPGYKEEGLKDWMYSKDEYVSNQRETDTYPLKDNLWEKNAIGQHRKAVGEALRTTLKDEALPNGNRTDMNLFERAIYDGEISAIKAKEIIESSQLEVPEQILKLAEQEVSKQKQEPVKTNIEPEVATKLRNIASKIREGKISRIQGFKTNTPFGIAWDGGLEVLATTLETTADLAVSIDKALTHIKNTDWYKGLTKDKQEEFDSKFASHIDKELGDEYRDATKHKFINQEVEERFEQSVLNEKTFIDNVKEIFSDLRSKVLRTYKDLPKNKQFAEAYNAINQFEKAINISSGRSGEMVKDILGNMKKPDYDLFAKKIIFEDLQETVKLNPEYELPYGLTAETVDEELKNINKYVAFNDNVKKAIERRKKHYEKIQASYIEWADKIGVKTDGFFNRNEYFRHQVLLYAEASKKGSIENKGGPLARPKKLSVFKTRAQGAGYDINRNYIEAEFEVFNKLNYSIEKMKMIDNIYRNYDIIDKLKKEAKEELGEEATRSEVERWIHDNVPNGYVIDSPENMNIFMATSIPEQMANELLMGTADEIGIGKDDLRKIFALGRAKQIVIPVEIYRTLDSISRLNIQDRFSKAMKKLLTGWKVWTLIQPKRLFKYNVRNITGDAEAVFLGNPRVFKKAFSAASELYDVYVKGSSPTETMNEYISRGGMQLVMTTQEIGELKKVKEFEKYFDKKKGIVETGKRAIKTGFDKYWSVAKLTTDFREQLLRYAAFKEWLSEIENNDGKVKNYGASNPEFIDGLSDKYDKAFRLSNELLGAYDQISEAGRNLRSYWIPFWSFQEINFRRTNQMFLNTLKSEKSLSGKTLKGIEFAAKKTPMIALNAAKLTIKLTGFWAMTAVWNWLLFSDEEDELPEEIKSKPHIIFGRNPDGTVRYISRLGVMGDYLEWFGLDAAPQYVNEYLAGRMSTKDIAVDMAKSPVNKIVNGINPYIKTTAELLFRKSLFPDVFKPKVIRNYGEQIAINLGLKDEYRAISRLPDQEYYKSMRKVFWDEIDPMASSYWSIMSLKYRYKEKKGNASSGSYTVSDKSMALYYYKQSLTYGDIKSAEYYLDRFIMLGGTKEGYDLSMKYLDPLQGIKKEELEDFKKYIGVKNQNEFDQAVNYYKKVLSLEMEWPEDKKEKQNEGNPVE